MTEQLFLTLGGMCLLAAGIGAMESMARGMSFGRVLSFAVCACGIAVIWAGAVRSGSAASLRVAILGTFSASGGFLGGLPAAMLAKRRAGAVLVNLGTGVPAGVKVISAVAALVGIPAVIMQLIETPRSAATPLLFGQALMFLMFAARSGLLVATKWVLTEAGILGPNAFVPWRQVLDFDWQEPDTLLIATSAEFRGGRRLTIPVLPAVREAAAAVLAGKVAAR